MRIILFLGSLFLTTFLMGCFGQNNSLHEDYLVKRILSSDEIESFEKPIIAAINGIALGGGCELSLTCDLRIASDTARIGVPEINIGALPGGGGPTRLPRLVGISKAKEMIYTGDPIDAREAYRIGLVNKVVPANDLMKETRKLAEKLAEKPILPLRMAKSIINTGINEDMKSALENEIRGVSLLFCTDDQKEGMNAFLEKRKAVFTGK